MSDRILITGGYGFLGRHVQEAAIKAGIPFEVLDIAGVSPFWMHDIRNPLPPIPNITRVIHLAGLLGTHELFDNVEAAIDVNIKGTVNVLEFCRQNEIPYTGVSMSHVWKNPYETTKLAGQRLADAWSREYGFPVDYLTVYNAYGEYQHHGPGHPQKIIPTFARAAWEKRPIPIWGDGTQVVDLVYAGDVADVLVNPLGGYYEGGYGIPSDVTSVAKEVWRIVNGNEPPLLQYHPMRRGEHGLTWPVANYPILPQEGIRETLERTVQWYKDRPVYP